MRELTVEEMQTANGLGRYRSYIYYTTGGQETVGYESVPWDAPYSQAEINEMTGKLQRFLQQHDYQEPYNSGSQYDTSGWHLSFFTNIDDWYYGQFQQLMWGSHAKDRGYWNFLATSHPVSTSNAITVDAAAPSVFTFTIGGLLAAGVFHPGAYVPTNTGPTGDVVVTGTTGYWSVTYNIDSTTMIANTVPSPSDFTGYARGESLAPYQHPDGGHMQPGTTRKLSSAEVDMAYAFLHPLVPSLTRDDIASVDIGPGFTLGDAPAMTLSANTIRFDIRFALNDFSRNPDTMDLLIHELYHVAQWARTTSIFQFAASSIERAYKGERVYDYEYRELPRFPSLNIEQQAQIAQDAFRLKNGLNPMGAKGFIPSYNDLIDAIGLGQP